MLPQIYYFYSAARVRVPGPYCAHKAEVFAGAVKASVFAGGQAESPTTDPQASTDAVIGEVFCPGAARVGRLIAAAVFNPGEAASSQQVGSVFQGGSVIGQAACDGE